MPEEAAHSLYGCYRLSAVPRPLGGSGRASRPALRIGRSGLVDHESRDVGRKPAAAPRAASCIASSRLGVERGEYAASPPYPPSPSSIESCSRNPSYTRLGEEDRAVNHHEQLRDYPRVPESTRDHEQLRSQTSPAEFSPTRVGKVVHRDAYCSPRSGRSSSVLTRAGSAPTARTPDAQECRGWRR